MSGCSPSLTFSFSTTIHKEWNLCPACFSGGDSDNGSDAGAEAWADTARERYKARFMMPDGRIIDTANGNVSRIRKVRASPCSAVANNDRPAFDKLWRWTDNTLRNKSNGLFYWRYNPVAPDPIADKTTPPMAIP